MTYLFGINEIEQELVGSAFMTAFNDDEEEDEEEVDGEGDDEEGDDEEVLE